ncbi:MAG: hypothetical protein E7254_01740 [Lachnospiraceae bacterium]|nr:hypothetical protein [Lachnospiraceae bacterium]
MRAKLLLIYLILIIVTPIWCKSLNDTAADSARKMLVNIPCPDGVELVDDVAAAGRLMGTKHQAQAFGAVLIKTKLSKEALESYYSKNKNIYVAEQKEAKIKQITRKNVKFSKFGKGKHMYIVYLWAKPEYKIAKYLDYRAWSINKETIDKYIKFDK